MATTSSKSPGSATSGAAGKVGLVERLQPEGVLRLPLISPSDGNT